MNNIITHGSLFSGIGGFDLAATHTGWENIFHCEWNPFGQRILKYYWPNAISYEDINKTNFSVHNGRIDVVSGGFPCQPYSIAGKRLGKNDERHLWPQMYRAIQEIEPTFVVGENVYGITNWNGGLVFEEVCVDLENIGYEVLPILLPAVSIGAPHRRDRIWIIAYSNNKRRNIWRNNRKERYICENRRSSEEDQSKWQRWECGSGEIGEIAANACQLRRNPGRTEQPLSGDSTASEEEQALLHTNSTSEQGEYICKKRQGEFDRSNSRTRINAFKDFPTQSPICCRNDGLPSKLDGITFSNWKIESIKAYGNAVVPSLVQQIFLIIDTLLKQ